MDISSLRNIFMIDESRTEEEAIIEIETIMNTPVEQPVTAEERIAAAMEFQNLMML
jgi:hypothetical protein